MGIFPGQPITNSTAFLTFYFLGLSSTLVYPILDLDSFVLLRFLGTTTYDADSMVFLVKRFNQLVGLSSSILLSILGRGADCSYWSWFLFLSYMGASFYVYSLTQSYIFVGKRAMLLVFLISLGSHGLLMSSIKLMFSKFHRYLSNNAAWRFYIFAAGSFSSSLLLKILVKLNAGEPFSDFDSDNTLVLFNRLFVCFTLIILATCFLLSSFACKENEEKENLVPVASFMESLFMNNIWVFVTACFTWASTPLLNNLGLALLHTVPKKEAFIFQYYQFMSCLGVTFVIFFTDYFDLESYKKGGYIYNSLYRSVCLMLRYRSFTPIDPKETRHQDVREDMELMSKVLKIRLFRDPQPWPMAPYGFWSEWEEYDNFDLTRIFNIMGMYLSITDIRNQDPFKSDAYYVLRFSRRPTPQENYRTIKKHKYTLLWLTCSFINYCNILITKIPNIFASSQCATLESCCIAALTKSQHCCCAKECQLQQSECSGGCCCSSGNCDILKSYITNALKGCVEDANALLFDINSNPYLADSLTVNYEDMMFSLGVFEELLLRLVVILIYGRIADEYLTIQKYIGPVCRKLSKDCKKFQEKCKCTNGSQGTGCKCCCTMYCKMLQCVCKLHYRQKQACDIMKGTSLENLIDVMPPISLSRAVLILSSIFHEIIESEFLYEDGNCNCKKQDETKCCCLGNMLCYCCRFNSRIDDILSLMLQALDKVTDCDAILTNVIKVMSSFTSFKYPVKFYEGIYPIDGIPPDDEAASDSSNILSVFANIYTQFSDLMSVLLPPGHFRPGTSCCWIDESGLCKCIRTLLEFMREVCCMIDKVSGEIGNTSVSVCYILNYNKIDELYKRLDCSAKKFKCFATCVKSCTCLNCTCCTGNGTKVGEFVEKLGESLCSTIKLVEELNKQSKESIKSLSTSLQNELAELNRKNTNIYNSIRGTRMGMMTEPCKMMSKMITYYKNTIVGRVPDYGSFSFYFFLLVSGICLTLLYVGSLIPYFRNIPKFKRYKYLIIIYSVATSYYLNSSFGFLSSFGDESAYYVSLAIILGMVISIIYSWLTQWFTFRMFLYEQFTELYKRFRVLFPGSRYLYNPPFLWWLEGFVSFLAMDMVSMKNLVTFTNPKQTYNPFDFGFTSRLNVTYDIVESEPHIFTEDECLKNIKKTVFHSQYLDFLSLLEYRSFYHVYATDCSFLKRESIKEVNYPMDLLYHAWVLGFTVGDLSDRLYSLRELAIKSVEKNLQRQATANKYDMKSINTLKIFFDFQHECMLEAPKLAVQDSFYKSQHFLTVQSRKLLRLYERVYSDKWKVFLRDYEEMVTRKRGVETLIPDLKLDQLVQSYEAWLLVKKRNCDMRYGRNEICKLAVQRTSEEFEEYLYRPMDVSDILSDFMKFVSTSYTVKDIPKTFEVLKYLSKPVNPYENREVKPILEKIAQLIRGHSFGYRSSIITDFLGVCKNIEIESQMVDTIYKHESYLVGEWLRWQGLNVPGDMVLVIIQFLVF